jgi:hypothetical protein
VADVIAFEKQAHEPLSETGAHDTRIRLSSCRIHITTRFQLALFGSTNSK